MSKITASTSLNVGTELTINLGAKTFTLVAAGNLVAKDGVTFQALYTKFIKLWTSSTYNNYPFPFQALDAKSGQWVIGYDGVYYNGWAPADDTTRSYIRDAGWSEYNSSGVLQRQFVGVVSLGTINSSSGTTQPYYQKSSGGSATNFTYLAAVNEPVKVYEVSSFDTRTYFKTYLREYNYTYSESILGDTGETGTGAYKVNFLLSNLSDSKIQAADATVAANAPYTGVTATWLIGNGFTAASVGSLVANDVRQDGAGRWFKCTVGGTIDAAGVANYTLNGGSATLTSYSGERQIGTSYYAFNIIVDGNSTTKEKIYTKIQYLLRQNSDIDSASGGHTGKITASMMAFTGDTLVTTTGVYIDNYLVADKNNLQFTDVGGTVRSNPYAAQGTLSFDSTLTSGGTGKYRMYFTTNPSGNWGSTSAVTVNDASGNPITGTITGSSIAFTYDYDGNVQGGRTAATDAAVTIVSVNPGSSVPIYTTATLTRSSSIGINIVGTADLAYTATGIATTTFNGSTKVATLPTSTTTMSVLALWSRYVDWLTTTTNMGYATAMTLVGGQTIDAGAGTSIPKYVFLQNSWQIQPNLANHTLAVTSGVILVSGGGDPFKDSSTYTVRINYQQPVQAIGTGGNITSQDILDLRLTNLLVKDGLS